MKKINASILVFAFFISLFIWFALKFTQTQQVNIQIPIAIANTPTSLIPMDIEPRSINLVIAGRGDKLIKFHLKNYSYYLNLQNVHYGKNYISFDIKNIKGLEKYDLNIIQYPQLLDILVVMDNMTTQTFPVNPIFADAESKKYFESHNLETYPQQIQVKGPKKIISEFIHIDTQPFNMKKHSENSTISLILPQSDLVTALVGNVKIVKSKPKIIRKAFPLIRISYPDSLEIFPQFISLIVEGESKLLRTLSKQDFEIQIDPNYTLLVEHPVALDIQLPEGVTLISQTPKKVNFRGIIDPKKFIEK
ncbi:MAG: hypothetical protein U9P79_09520 [Candidatus Cloacimonadota bacterium]|nr:hypothetical protein [Candidatus Cloacimonadota bacterium]